VQQSLPLCFMFSFSTAVSADLTLEPMVVTATRTAQSKTDVLASVDIITQAELQRKQVRSLPELLAGRAGIDVDTSGGFGTQSAVRIRGTNADHILVLVDGVKMGSVSAGTFAFENFPVEMIERIEIVKGPRSSLYGSEAIGGVIHIFTKKGGDKAFIPTVKVSYGTHETAETSIGLAGTIGATSYGISAKYFNTEGIDSTNENNAFANNLDKDGYDEGSISLNLTHQFSDTLDASIHALRAEGNIEIDLGFVGRDSTDVAQQAVGISTTWSPLAIWSTTVSISESRDESETFGNIPSVFDTAREQWSWQNDFTVWEDHIFTIGYDFQEDKVQSTTAFDANSRDNKAVFVQWQGGWQALDWAAAARHDDNQAFGTEDTGSLALGYTFNNALKTTLSYGTGFKAPTFNDLFFPFTDFGFGFTFQGNPDLKPERSESWEWGLQQKTAWGHWQVNLFYTKIEDLITLSADFSTIENIDNARIRGLEAVIESTVWGWDTRFQFTYTDPRDVDTKQVLARRSLRSASLSMDRQFGALGVGADIIAKGHSFNDADNNVRLSGYHLTHVRATYDIDSHWQLQGKVNNLFNKRFDTVSGFNTLDRNIFVGFRYQ